MSPTHNNKIINGLKGNKTHERKTEKESSDREEDSKSFENSFDDH